MTEPPAKQPEDVDTSQETVSTEQVWPYSDIRKLILPPGWIFCDLGNEEVSMVHLDKDLNTDKSITLKSTEKPVIQINGRVVDLPDIEYMENDRNVSRAKTILSHLSLLKICAGTGMERKKFSVHCSGGIGNHAIRCPECHAEKNRLKLKEERQAKIKKRQKDKIIKHKTQEQNLKRSKANLLAKVCPYTYNFPSKERGKYVAVILILLKKNSHLSLLLFVPD